jgi:TP901-1 family phage major tail protein
VAGLRSRRLSFSTETVDVTDAKNAGRWRELLGGAGVQRASLTGAAIFKDQASDALVRNACFGGTIFSAGGHSGSRHHHRAVPLSALEYPGEHNGEVRFGLAFESAGALTFAVL